MEFNDILRMAGLEPRDVALALHKMSTRAARGIVCQMVEEDPVSFRFSILDLLSPSAEAPDVIQCERKWMTRLATITHGLNS